MPKILAIDDKQDNLISISALLNNLIPDCQLLTARSGAEGIEKAKAELPDTILLDVIMPEMDGFEACRILKSDEDVKHIPVIMLTAIKTDSKSRANGLEMGADAFLSKPVDEAELAAQINAMLRIKKAEDLLHKEKDLLDNLVSERTKALQESEHRYRSLFEQSNDAIIIHDLNGHILDVNHRALEMLGYDRKQFLGMNIPMLHPTSELEASEAAFKETSEKGHIRFESKFTRSDGSIVEVEISSRITDKEKGVVHGIIRDITDRKHAENLLRVSEGKYRALVENTPDIVMRFGKDYRHLYVSSAVKNVTNIEPDAFVGKTYRDLGFPEEQCRFFEENIKRVFDTGNPFETEFTFEGKAGKLIFNWRIFPELDVKGKVASILAIARDITEQRRTEQEYHTLFEKMLDGFALHEIICDEEGKPVDYRFLAANPAFEQMTGLKVQDIIGKTVLEVLPGTEPHWIETYGRVALTGESIFFENYAQELDSYFEVTAYQPEERQFACIFQDVTERKKAQIEKEKLEIQLQQAQKMESIGTLAGGVAHDFNNILSPIMIHSEMAMAELAHDHHIQHNLKQIFQAGERARDLVKQILTFSRMRQKERTPLRLGLIVKENIKFLRASLPSTIEISENIIAESDTVLSNPTQINQILMNLSSNAAHAMREKGGKLEISLIDEYLDSEGASRFHELPPGSYIRLTVGDTGQGMDIETMKRIFDPYYTTKAPGEGTGMGLAVVHGIVRSYGGDITVESELGEETTFHVLLPRIEADALSSTEQKVEIPNGSERVLFVDDEKAAVDAIQPMLENLGYKVTARTSSIEALEAFRSKPHAFDLVITDQTMPNMPGKDLAKELMSIRLDIPIILCTGFSEQIDERRAKEMGISAFVMKPIVMREMANTIREVLDQEKGD